MKTLKELNSKWYWRLIKIIFFFFVWLILIWIWYTTFDNAFEWRAKSYSPEYISKLDKNVLEIKEYISSLNKKFPNKDIKYTEINPNKNEYSKYEKYRKDALIKDIRYLLAMDRSIEGLTPSLQNDNLNKKICENGDGNGNGLINFLNNGPMNGKWGIYWVDWCGIKDLKEVINKINNYKLWSFDEDLYKSFFDDYIYKDYISFSQKFLWIILWSIYFVLWLIPLLIFVFLVRTLAYYVIFGKIFPPK